MTRACLLVIALALAAAPAAAAEDLGGFDPIRSFSAAPEQRGRAVEGVVDVRVDDAVVVARVVRDGRLLGRVELGTVAAGAHDVRVPLFRSARELLRRRGALRVRIEVSVDPPADPPQRERRRVRLRP